MQSTVVANHSENQLRHVGHTENKHSFAKSIWPMSGSAGSKYTSVLILCQRENMWCRITFPPSRPEAERGQNRARWWSATAVHPPVTPSDWQGPGVKASFSPLIASWLPLQIGISAGSPRAAHISIPTWWLALVCWMMTKKAEGGNWPIF